jgi:mannose-1-phosphate guanylyltransferase
VDAADTVVVVDESMRDLADTQLRDFPGVTRVCQPGNRGTAPGILLPLMELRRRDRSATVVVVPSDHAFRNPGDFREAIRRAVMEVARGRSRLVLVGSEASQPAEDLGWILPRRAAPGLTREALPVERFEEKPSPERARALLGAGALWNTMILVARSDALVDLFRQRVPATTRVFEDLPSVPEDARASWLRLRYDALPTTDFSTHILEGTPDLTVVPLHRDAGWTDLGTPGRLAAWLQGIPRDAPANPGSLGVPLTLKEVNHG